MIDVDAFINMALRLLGLAQVEKALTEAKVAQGQDALAVASAEIEKLKAYIAELEASAEDKVVH